MPDSFDVGCVLCDQPLDPRYHENVILPLARVHVGCWQRDGRTPDELAGEVDCCIGKRFLKNMGGRIVEASDKVPPDQFWVSLPAEKKIRRFRFGVDEAGLFIRPVNEIARFD